MNQAMRRSILAPLLAQTLRDDWTAAASILRYLIRLRSLETSFARARSHEDLKAPFDGASPSGCPVSPLGGTHP